MCIRDSCLVQVGAGGVDLLGEQERRMNTRAGQFAGVVIGRDVQAVSYTHLDVYKRQILNKRRRATSDRRRAPSS